MLFHPNIQRHIISLCETSILKDEAVELDSCNLFLKIACVYHSSIRHAHYAQGSLTEMQKLHQPDAYQIPYGVVGERACSDQAHHSI